MMYYDDHSGVFSVRAIMVAFLLCAFLLHVEMSQMLENHRVNVRYGLLSKELRRLEDESKSIKATLFRPDVDLKKENQQALVAATGKRVKLISRLSAWSKA